MDPSIKEVRKEHHKKVVLVREWVGQGYRGGRGGGGGVKGRTNPQVLSGH